MTKTRRVSPPAKITDRHYRQLWRVVAGAVVDAFEQHPDYLAPNKRNAAIRSVTKRVTGAVLGYAEQSVKRRSEANASAAINDRGARATSGQSDAGFTPPRGRGWGLNLPAIFRLPWRRA